MGTGDARAPDSGTHSLSTHEWGGSRAAPPSCILGGGVGIAPLGAGMLVVSGGYWRIWTNFFFLFVAGPFTARTTRKCWARGAVGSQGPCSGLCLKS